MVCDMCGGGGGRREAGGGARDTESKTRTPHKVVGKNLTKPNRVKCQTSYSKQHHGETEINSSNRRYVQLIRLHILSKHQ